MTGDRSARVVIIDAAVAPTGGLRGAINIARAIGTTAETRLVLSTASSVDTVDLSTFGDVVRVPMRQIRRSPVDVALFGPTLLAAGLRLRRMLRPDDVLVVNDFYLLHGWLMRRLNFHGRIVTWVRIDPLAFPAPLRRAWIAAMRAASDEIVAVSRFIADRLAAEGVVARVVYDPVDPSLAPAARPARGQRIVQIANFTRGKGQDDAIAAFARIAPRFARASLMLQGGDMGVPRNREYRAALEQQAQVSGVGERIVFRGFARDVGAALAEADIALVLSHRESFSLACLEASQSGLPVVATRCGGPEEIIEEGRTGLLCDVGDVAAIAAAMERLLNDPVEAAALGTRGAASVRERFAPADFEAAVGEICLAGRRTDRRHRLSRV